MIKEEYITICQIQYPFLDEYSLGIIFETAKRELFITLYSSNTSEIDNQTEIPYIYEMKVLDCMQEIIDLSTARHFTSYQENGLRWNRPTRGYKAYQNINGYAMVG